MKRLTQRDRDDFALYCANCSDAQVQGVIEKERKAGRVAYQRIAEDEQARRQTAASPRR